MERWTINLIYICLLVVIIFVVLITKVKTISISKIFKDYFKIFRNKESMDFVLVLFIFIVPVIIAMFTFVNFPLKVDGEENWFDYSGANLIITVLDALFFSVFGLVLQIKSDLQANKNKSGLEMEQYMRDINEVSVINLMEIIFSLIDLSLGFIGIVIGKTNAILVSMIIFFTMVIILNMLMLMKKIYNLISV